MLGRPLGRGLSRLLSRPLSGGIVPAADFLAFAKSSVSNSRTHGGRHYIADQATGNGDPRLRLGDVCVAPKGTVYGIVDNSDGALDPGAQDFELEWDGSRPESGVTETVNSSRSGGAESWQLLIQETNVIFSTWATTATTATLPHGLSSGAYASFRLFKSGTSVELYVDGVLESTSASVKETLDPGGDSLTVFARNTGGAEAYNSLLSQLKITIGGNVVGWWRTGVEMSGASCPSLITGGRPINWVGLPLAGLHTSDPGAGISINPADEWGYLDDGGAIVPAAEGSDQTYDGRDLTYAGKAGHDFELHRRVAVMDGKISVNPVPVFGTHDVSFWIKSTATTSIILGDSDQKYAGVFESGSSSSFRGHATVSDIIVDGSSQGSDVTRDSMYQLVMDGGWHFVEFAGADLSVFDGLGCFVAGWKPGTNIYDLDGQLANFKISGVLDMPLEIGLEDTSGNGHNGMVIENVEFADRTNEVPSRAWTDGLVDLGGGSYRIPADGETPDIAPYSKEGAIAARMGASAQDYAFGREFDPDAITDLADPADLISPEDWPDGAETHGIETGPGGEWIANKFPAE